MNNYYNFGEFVQPILTGVFGCILLVIFFAGFMSLGTIGKLLPFVIGFNTALTGYNLLRRTKNRFKCKRIWGLISGIITVVITVLILNVLFFYLTGGYIVYMTDFLRLISIGSVFSWLGAILAIKYLNLDPK
jgi:hypothetical protein